MPEWKEEIRRRLAGLKLEPAREAAIIEELAQHLDDHYAESLSGGATEAEACRAALTELSESGTLQRELRRVEREVAPEPIVLGINKRRNVIADFWQDLRYAMRTLRNHPGFAAVVVLTLALGIGANTAIFSVVNAVLLRSLPYRDPDRLVLLHQRRPQEGTMLALGADFLDWRDQAKSFEKIAAYDQRAADLTGSVEAERLSAGIVSADLFATLGVAPALGRGFTPAEDIPGGPPVVILSNDLWRRRFGGDPQVIGRTITLEGQTRTVIGIMPSGFRFPSRSDLWLPLALNVTQELGRQTGLLVLVIARLKPGVTPEAARADLSVILERQRQAYPHVYSDERISVIGLSETLVGNVRQALLVLFGVVAFVLLIACANVANLLLARSAARRKEMAIRAAVGAGRLRLVRQLLIESLLVSLAGGASGLLAANWCVKLLVAMSPSGIERIEESSLDGRVLGFTCIVVVLVGLIAGIFPALQASKVDVNETLKAQSTAGDARTVHTRYGAVRRMMPALMIAELALALVLLVGAGLMIKSFLRLVAVPKGFSPDGLLTLELSPSIASYPYESPRRDVYFQESLAHAQALPGIQSAALASGIPPFGPWLIQPLQIEGRPPFERGKEPMVLHSSISPEYFQTVGIEMRAGRPFNRQDGREAPHVIVINETLARRLFPNENPIGHRLLTWGPPLTKVLPIV